MNQQQEVEKRIFEGDSTSVQFVSRGIIPPEDIIELNVGGEHFTTLKHTIRNVSPTIFNSNIVRDVNGRVFIDRDPALFRMLLNGLRRGQVWPTPPDPVELANFASELDYFGLSVTPVRHEREGNVYVLGGRDDQFNFLNSVEMFDQKAQQWMKMPPMNTCRDIPGAVAHKGKIYVVGGWDEADNELAIVEVFDIKSMEWTLITSMQESRVGCEVVVCENKIYILGGEWKDTVMTFDPISKIWAYAPPMLTVRGRFAATVLDGMIYTMGGSDGEHYLKTVEVFNPSSQHWSHIPSMPVIRYAFASVGFKGIIYVIGGWNGCQHVRTMDAFDPSTYRWTSTPLMTTARGGCAQ